MDERKLPIEPLDGNVAIAYREPIGIDRLPPVVGDKIMYNSYIYQEKEILGRMSEERKEWLNEQNLMNHPLPRTGRIVEDIGEAWKVKVSVISPDPERICIVKKSDVRHVMGERQRKALDELDHQS